MNRDPNDPTPLDPTTGVREISSDEFSKRVAAQVNGSGTNGVHHASEPDPGFFATHEEADEAKSSESQEPESGHTTWTPKAPSCLHFYLIQMHCQRYGHPDTGALLLGELTV